MLRRMALVVFLLLCAIPVVAFAYCVVKAWRTWLEIVELHASKGSDD